MKTKLSLALVIMALVAILGFSNLDAHASRASSCPMSGPYQAQGTLPGSAGSLTVKISGKFVNTGVGGCFTSGTGSYNLSSGAQGSLAVHTDWTTYWSTPTGLFLPSQANSGAISGQQMMVIACSGNGDLEVPVYPNGGNMYAPGNGVSYPFNCVANTISVWFLSQTCYDTSCWNPTILPDYQGPGKVSG